MWVKCSWVSFGFFVVSLEVVLELDRAGVHGDDDGGGVGRRLRFVDVKNELRVVC